MTIDRDALVDWLDRLVRIDSTNPTLEAGSAGEEQIAALVADVMRDLGLAVETIESAPGRTSVVGVRPGTGTGRSLMLNAHTDTVGVDGMEAPFTPRIENGRMYGRGTQDMKGSLAAQLAAVKALNEAGIEMAGDLVVAAVADEEAMSVGTESILPQYATDGAIVTEPTDLELCLAHKGFVWLDVTTRGRAAHGSRPSEGIDANRHMGRVLHRLDALDDQLAQHSGHPLVDAPSLHAAQIEGGSAPSIYAAECWMRVERRTIPGETAADARDELQEILDALSAEDDAFDASLAVDFNRDPFEVAADAPIATATRTAATDVLGTAPPDAGQTYWTDAGLLAKADVETVVLGPIGAGLHTTEEWVDLDSLVHLARILAQTAQQYCGAQSGTAS